jgi:hypothetical protein
MLPPGGKRKGPRPINDRGPAHHNKPILSSKYTRLFDDVRHEKVIEFAPDSGDRAGHRAPGTLVLPGDLLDLHAGGQKMKYQRFCEPEATDELLKIDLRQSY